MTNAGLSLGYGGGGGSVSQRPLFGTGFTSTGISLQSFARSHRTNAASSSISQQHSRSSPTRPVAVIKGGAAATSHRYPAYLSAMVGIATRVDDDQHHSNMKVIEENGSHWMGQEDKCSPEDLIIHPDTRLSIPLYLNLPRRLAGLPLFTPSPTSSLSLSLSPSISTIGSDVSVTPTPSFSLPTHWNPKDKSSLLDLSHNHQRITYTGPGKSDVDAASVRANVSIPPAVGIFYWEITVISKGRDGYIGIGFCCEKISMGRLPGWEDGSWGYHGDDGNAFCCSGTGKKFGPSFGTGDVVGVLINFFEGSASYTKNGYFLGTAFPKFLSTIKDKKHGPAIFPVVGLRTPGEVVESNFGQKPFQFDIEGYVKEEKARLFSEVIQHPLSMAEPAMPDTDVMINEIILSHLRHFGYVDTCTALQNAQDTSLATSSSPAERPFNQAMKNRIRNLILRGDLETLETELPRDLIQGNRGIHCSILCHRFVELYAQAFANNRLYSMDVDMKDGGDDEGLALFQLVEFGRFIQAEFEGAESAFQDCMAQVFSLVCYSDPWSCPVSFLLDVRNREDLADLVHSACLAYYGEPEYSNLERIVQQSLLTRQEMERTGVPSATILQGWLAELLR